MRATREAYATNHQDISSLRNFFFWDIAPIDNHIPILTERSKIGLKKNEN